MTDLTVIERFVCKIGFLQTLGKTGKNMYIYYEHENIGQFLNTVNGDEAFAMKEINNLIAVMKDIPGITGLLIMDFLVRLNILYR